MAAGQSGRSSTRTPSYGRKWVPQPPNVDPEYFFSGDTVQELARAIANPYQTRPMPAATLQETVTRYFTYFCYMTLAKGLRVPLPLSQHAIPPHHRAGQEHDSGRESEEGPNRLR